MYIGTTTTNRGIESQVYYGTEKEISVHRSDGIDSGITITGYSNEELQGKDVHVELTLDEARRVAEAYRLLMADILSINK